MREPNKAIQRERHHMPAIDERIDDLNGPKFLVRRLCAVYYQHELHEDSRYIATFSIHLGLYRYNTLTLEYAPLQYIPRSHTQSYLQYPQKKTRHRTRS